MLVSNRRNGEVEHLWRGQFGRTNLGTSIETCLDRGAISVLPVFPKLLTTSNDEFSPLSGAP